jgi:lipopolysaccharide transport system permease protein
MAMALMRAATIIDASGTRLQAQITEYASYRSLFWFLMMRDIKLRYRQTALGVAWAVIQPLFPMVIVTVIFARILGPRTGALPYWLFALAGFAPWNFFASAVMTSSMTFVNNRNLLSRVYFPRAIVPAAATAGCMLDWLVSTSLVLGLILVRGYHARPGWLLLPVVIAAGIAVATSVGLGMASLTAMYRDVRHVFPFLVQIWMYATPVVYPLTMVRRPLQLAIALNPMTGIVEAFRACLFGTPSDWTVLALSLLAAISISAVSLFVFFRLDADLAEQA